jgi:peroxiredoxin
LTRLPSPFAPPCPSDRARSFRHMLASLVAGVDAIVILAIVLFSVD